MNQNLRFGSQGNAVQQLQSLLNQLQSVAAKLVEDGIFGPQTRLRVLEFQGKAGIPPSGIVDSGTWGKLLGPQAGGSNGGSTGPSQNYANSNAGAAPAPTTLAAPVDYGDLSPRRKRVLESLLPAVVPSRYPEPKFQQLTGGVNHSDPNLPPHYTTCGCLPSYVARALGGHGMIQSGGLDGLRTAAKKQDAWVVAELGLRPKPGDLYGLCNGANPSSLIVHVGVIVDASGEIWKTADAGQRANYVNRQYNPQTGTLSGEVSNSGNRPPRLVAGWVDIDKYPFTSYTKRFEFFAAAGFPTRPSGARKLPPRSSARHAKSLRRPSHVIPLCAVKSSNVVVPRRLHLLSWRVVYLPNIERSEVSMSGHSKWATIKHKKAAIDAKRGKVFTRLIKEIMIAARSGGGDPDANARLRTAIAAGKAVSMPAENIKRAVMRGTGELEGGQLDEITFEGYGPGGAAVMVKVATDNRNRTVSEIRHAFSKNGGNLGEVGSVGWMFDRKSQIIIEADKIGEEALMNLVLEAGGDDIQNDGANWEVLSPPEAHEAVLEAIQKANIPTVSAEVAMVPKNLVHIEGSNARVMLKLLEVMEEHDDVQNVWSNYDIDEDELESLAG